MRLTGLGLSLDEVRDALGDPSGAEFRDIRAEVEADLEREQVQLCSRRERIAEAVAAEDHLAPSPAVAILLARIRGSGADPESLRAEQQALELFEASMAPAVFGELAGGQSVHPGSHISSGRCRWIARRPHGVPAGAHPVGYGSDQVALVITFVVLTAGEVAAVELFIPWPALRILLLILGGYGLLVMIGFVAISRTRPHVLTRDRVRLRCGLSADITLGSADFASVTSIRSSCSYRPTITDGVLVMGAGNQTQLEITLCLPRIMSVDRAAGTVERIRISADHPTAAVQALRGSSNAM